MPVAAPLQKRPCVPAPLDILFRTFTPITTRSFSMRAARPCALTLLAICFATGTALADPTPPSITSSVAGTVGNNGRYVSDVTVSWNVSDESPRSPRPPVAVRRS